MRTSVKESWPGPSLDRLFEILKIGPAKKKLVIRIVIVWFLLSVASGVWQFVDGMVVDREVQRARASAMVSASNSTTPQSARDWLQRNGYEVVFWNPHDSLGYIGREDGSDGKFTIVYGQRQVRHGHLLMSRPTWIDVDFRFTGDGTFHDITSRTSTSSISAGQRAVLRKLKE